MKGLIVMAVLAACTAGTHARIVVLSLEADMHTDAWCLSHGGSGPSTCVENSGCSYDGSTGSCHSSTAHSDSWCAQYGVANGSPDLKTCIGFAGCTYDSKNTVCKSNSDPSAILDEITCEEALACSQGTGEGQGGGCGSQAATLWSESYGADAQKTAKIAACVKAGGNTADCTTSVEKSAASGGSGSGDSDGSSTQDGEVYTPQCDPQGEWIETQYSGADAADADKKWCVDANGHEIPDTRSSSKQFQKLMTNCDKERMKHAGMQCPNAVTLTTLDGEVMINNDPDVGNCDITCNTDQDCKGEQWCCYNGCGYACRLPITPKADCNDLPLDASLQATDLTTATQDCGKEDCAHGTQVRLSCAAGHSGSDAVTIECVHGTWDTYSMECLKDCESYTVPTGERARDYKISDGKHRDNDDGTVTHGSKRKISCVPGYGAVAGKPRVLLFEKETVTCKNGAWTEQTLVCSACYDAPGSGKFAWWSGIDADPPLLESDTNARTCQFFASRPLKCSEYPGAQENCRISCNWCEEGLRKYKVKKLKAYLGEGGEGLGHVKNPSKWLHARIRKHVGHDNYITEDRRTKIAKRVKKDGSRI